jgi:hypothetical protein
MVRLYRAVLPATSVLAGQAAGGDAAARGARPDQAYSRDAFMLLEREAPGRRQVASDRGCPLGTGFVRPMWHEGGAERCLGLRVRRRATPRPSAY